MKTEASFPKHYIMLLPFLGMVLFVILYTISAFLYPGGSWEHIAHSSFSFWNNYLCDLLDDYAINGELNSARYFARAALGVLCLSIILIWFFLPKLFNTSSKNLFIMKITGILSLSITLFLASGTHDVIIYIAGVFGITAVIFCLIELNKAKHYKLLTFGVFCLLIFIANYYIYETRNFEKILPVLQKFTFFGFMLWFAILNLRLYKKLKFIDKNKTS